MSSIYQLQQEHRQLKEERNALCLRLEALPKGEIRFHRSENHWRWRYVEQDSSGRTIFQNISRKDYSLAQKAAYRRYLTKQLSVVDQKIACIEIFLKNYPVSKKYADVFDEPCDDYRRLLAPLFENETRIEDWMAAPFESNPDHREHLNVQTRSGIVVRSKSEMMIADSLFDSHIPFRYEQVHQIGEITVYPDFTILNPKNPQKKMIWEYFGLIQYEQYARNAKQKMVMYIDAGYIEGHNLITTYENKETPLDINYVEALIDYHFR